MASYTLTAGGRFPVGTSVKAYPLSNWPAHLRPPSGAPVGSEDETAVVGSSGSAAFSALDADTRYVAYAEVASQHRYTAFATPAAEEAKGLDPTRAGFWGTPGGVLPNSVIAVGNLVMYVARFVPHQTRTITGGALLVSTVAGQDDAVAVGIFEAAAGGARLGSSPSTTGKLNGLGRRFVALSAPVTVEADTPYYGAVLAAKGAGAAAVLAARLHGAAMAYDAWRAGADGVAVDVGSLEFGYAVLGSVAIPAALPALTINTQAPVVAWRES